jgi:hypothetical protein
LPDKPDPHEIAIGWVPIEELTELPVISDIREQLIAAFNGPTPSFFEDDGSASMELDKR